MNTKHRLIYQISITAGACLLYAVSAGLRSVYGIMLGTISEKTGIAYTSVSFAIAIGQLAFGIAQPIFGIIALKKSNTFVLVTGSLLMAAGLAAIPFCFAKWMLILFLGILLPVGTGAVSFGMIMSTITLKLGEEKAVTASGIINASSGVGSIALSPIIQSAFSTVGLKLTMMGFALLTALLIPVSIAVSGTKKQETQTNSIAKIRIAALMKKTLCSKSYLFLMLGFFTCGFHMAVIETHLYSQIVSFGISESIAAIAFSIYGFASMGGSLASGFLCSKTQMKWVVGTLYGSRVVWILIFLLLPKTVPTVVVFAMLLGLTGAATVIPTSGLVGKLFGSENIATLFGVVFLSHQCGSFFSAWLGGICVEATGSYTLIWGVGVILSACAMLVSYYIAEPKKATSL